MGRTDWGPVIIGVVVLGAGAYAFFNWKNICHHLGEGACNWFNTTGATGTGIFGGTITGSGIAQGRGQILTTTDPTTGKVTTQRINPSVPVAGSQSVVKAKTTSSKPRLNASASVGVYGGSRAVPKHVKVVSRYADFNSFNTITLNRMSVR